MLPPQSYCEKTGKCCFDKRGAITASNARFEEDHTRLRVYPCPECGHWHLTKQLKEQPKKKYRNEQYIRKNRW